MAAQLNAQLGHQTYRNVTHQHSEPPRDTRLPNHEKPEIAKLTHSQKAGQIFTQAPPQIERAAEPIVENGGAAGAATLLRNARLARTKKRIFAMV